MGNCCKLIQNPHTHKHQRSDQYTYNNNANSTSKNDINYNLNDSLNASNKNLLKNNLSSININANTNNNNNDKRSDDGNLTFVPHIADFYPDDTTTIPTDNARASTLFLLKADSKKKPNENGSFNTSESNLQISKKFNSCSTIYVDNSTVSQPNLKNEIKLVACAIHLHIKRRTSDRNLDIFDEKHHPLFVRTPFPFYLF